MSVEHTSQLIQLILNSVMLMVGCALVLGRLSARYTGLEDQITLCKRQLVESFAQRRDRGLHASRYLRQLHRRRRLLSYGILLIHYALLFAIGSTLLMAMRTLIDLELLIPLALGLFLAAAASLFLAVGVTLLDLHLVNRPLLGEVQTLLTDQAVVDLPKLRASRRQSPEAVSRGRSSQARVS